MLNCPFLCPDRISNLFPGGTRSSSRDKMESSWSSFLAAIFQSLFGQALIAALVALPLKISSAALFLKPFIMESQYHGYHAMSTCTILPITGPSTIPVCGYLLSPVPFFRFNGKGQLLVFYVKDCIAVSHSLVSWSADAAHVDNILPVHFDWKGFG
jgi:hypothetical protein